MKEALKITNFRGEITIKSQEGVEQIDIWISGGALVEAKSFECDSITYPPETEVKVVYREERSDEKPK